MYNENKIGKPRTNDVTDPHVFADHGAFATATFTKINY
jgi:hypothetical protein